MDDNGLMMRCTQCGELNRLPVVHCKKCGAKLDFEAAEGRLLRAAGPTTGDRVRLVAKLAVAAILALTILLILWPGQLTRTTGDDLDAKRYRLKGELLIDALNRGMPTSQVIAEVEINAHLRELVAAQPEASGFSASLQDLGARFSADRAEVFVAIGRGPLTFTGKFVAKPRGAELRVVGAQAGHLPLPGILGRLYAGTQAGLFRQLKNEARILRNLDGVALKEGAIEVLIKPEP